ncbi:EamA family transporter [Candidatus Pacearchaeota archaeon]|nr:EamA family transporter [Candidatus Pacearchaeota archaeon]
MIPGLIFAVIAAIAFGIWTVFHQQASKHINNLFGAILVSLTAVVIGLIFFLPNVKNTTLYTDPKGIIFAVLAGVCALAIDFFVLKAYGQGLPISVGGPIIIGGSIALAVLIGFFMGESINFVKVLGISLIVVGGIVLSRV